MSASFSEDLSRRTVKRRTTAVQQVVTEEGDAVAVDPDVHLGRMLRRRRRLMGLSQTALAKACGTGFQQIQKYECGASRMSAARLWQVAGLLGVDLDYFFEGLPQIRRIDLLLELEQVEVVGEGPRSFARG